MMLSGVSMYGRGGPLGRGEALFNAAADLLAHIPDGIQRIQLPLGLPAPEQVRLSGQIRLLPTDSKAASQDVGYALGAQFTALPAVFPVEAPVVEAGVGDLGGDGSECLAV